MAVVPASSDKMLHKSLVTKSDIIVYDLEDSVPPTAADKDGARNRLTHFIKVYRAQKYQAMMYLRNDAKCTHA